jgi:serine/threonine protein kinase/WD40 repeat protein
MNSVQATGAADALNALAEEFTARRRRGERPTPEEYAARHRELADRIRELFPTLLLMEELGPDGGGASAPGGAPERLGEYRLLGEIGRGGMGVVYEAVQESLGRHVALKVLPPASAAQALHMERFQREARAAARLHHTNIVPVFGVGEEGGRHYYVMQFIQGRPLDQVLDELKRIRQRKDGTAEATPPPGADPTGTFAGGAGKVAASLLTGYFSLDPTPGAASLPPAVAPAPGDGPSAAEAADGAGSGTLSEPGRPYWQGVARVGVQVADALAYAHAQGVLHRDIKPSNLLLDTRGTVWVTDFGLAKAAENDDLTDTGDLVGTLRYMAPERFRGQSDGRGDVYALGVTLYELLTLQPAFAAEDRLQLVRAIAHETPPRPRDRAPGLPADLETIVLKAMAREPGDRYATAGEMAEDLRRFLADRAIRARRASPLEKVWRWCRHNPALARLSALAAVLLLGLAVALPVAAALRSERNEARENQQRAQRAEQEAHGLLARAETAEREARGRSLLAEASAVRRGRQMGQRFRALEKIAEAVALGPSDKLRGDLRNEAIACLALPDLRGAKEWSGWPVGTTHVDFDGALERYLRTDRQGNISVRRVADDAELYRICPGMGYCGAYLSADGKFVAATNRGWTKVWRLAPPGPVRIAEVKGANYYRIPFSPDGRRLGLPQTDGSIRVYDLEAGGDPRTLEHGPFPLCLAFHPREPRLAVGHRGGIQVRDCETGEVVADLPNAGSVEALAWRPDGETLAAAGLDRIVYLWHLPSRSCKVWLDGISDGGIELGFNHAGDLLASQAWDAMLRLWDPSTGEEIFRTPAPWGVRPLFGPGDRLLAADFRGDRLRLWELATSRVCRSLARGPGLGTGRRVYGPTAFSADGRVLVGAMADRLGYGLGFWDARSGAPLSSANIGAVRGVIADAPGALLTNSEVSGVRRWPVRVDPAAPGVVRVGPPEKLSLPGSYAVGPACSADGKVVASAQYSRGTLVWREGADGLLELKPHEDVRSVTVSPDGRWAASGSWNGLGARVWDLRTGKPVKELTPHESAVRVQFSPDGRWLAAMGDQSRLCLWAVGTWQEGPRLGEAGAFAFSPDGKVLAVETMQGEVRLIAAEDGTEYARLEAPGRARTGWLAFGPDGARLALTSSESNKIQVWDLRYLRSELDARGLDWKLPPYPPAAPPGAEPLRVEVDLGDLAPRSRDTTTGPGGL